MKQSFWLNIALLLAVALAGAFVYLRPPANGPVEHAVSGLAPGAATSVRIGRPGTETVALEKKDGTWFLVAPFAARADDFMVQRVLAILQARTAHRFAATDLGRFDLEDPRARLAIDGQIFEFGLVNELSREQYVRAGDAVYALSARYGLALPVRPEALASRRLLAPGETLVRIAAPGFSVARSDERWVLEPLPPGWSQDDVNRWVEEWQAAYALRIEPHPQGEASASVRIELANGKSLVIGILGREPEVVLLRADERLQYHFAAEAGKRLLSPAGAARQRPADRN
jgi:hypothetical protein